MIDTQHPTDPVSGVIERLLRRSLLLLTRDRTIAQDWLDLAELADAVGAPDIAQLGRDVAGLRLGFGSGEAIVGDAPVASIDRAVAELRHLMDRAPTPTTTTTATLTDAAQACHMLAGLLATPLDPAKDGQLTALLQAIEAAPPVDPRAHIHGDLVGMVSTFAAYELQHFVRRHHAIALPPYGSAALLHATAQLGPGGLGPYLGNARNIVRSSQDVIGLIVLAAGEKGAADSVAQWVVPLAACLPEGMFGDLIDDLADLGLMAPLEGLLAVAARRIDTPTPLRRLRDAALDLGNLDFALRVQTQILAKWPHDLVEWRRAGDLRGTAGDDAGAQAAFDYALRLAPADAVTDAHRTAQRAGDFEEYAATAGFGTPRHRHLLRMGRRAA